MDMIRCVLFQLQQYENKNKRPKRKRMGLHYTPIPNVRPLVTFKENYHLFLVGILNIAIQQVTSTH